MSARKCSTWFGFMIAFVLGLQGCSSTPSNITSMPSVKDTKVAKPKVTVEVKSPPQEQPNVIPQPSMDEY
jgi:hypothetical protein